MASKLLSRATGAAGAVADMPRLAAMSTWRAEPVLLSSAGDGHARPGVSPAHCQSQGQSAIISQRIAAGCPENAVLVSWGKIGMRWLHSLVPALALLLSGHAVAQTAYPDRPIKMIVPLAAASAVDVAARIVTQKMADNMGQQIVILNQP
ncbi:MAG: hypothetical protein Q7T45_25495 [Bradyrhizobium sp.]|uniref:hypothetical protein n=1 Tax=Bradyrhizobium sp. TaxID=376 RepID=UPI002724AEC1|nr:hypothetical protein [Bradyrhizobium sp.]MDO8401166.1 hypothetical protein [Bradyrhizobium sp.]